MLWYFESKEFKREQYHIEIDCEYIIQEEEFSKKEQLFIWMQGFRIQLMIMKAGQQLRTTSSQ